MGSADAVLFDAGGVLLLPTPAVMLPPLHAVGVDPTVDTLRRAHYLGTAARDADSGKDWELYRRTYARACGVPAGRVEQVAEDLGQVFDGRTWMQVAPGAVETLRHVAETGTPMAIVSNSVGTIAEMLEEAGVCQVGPGPHAEMAVVVDSAIIGIEKPAPGIFHHALASLGVTPGNAVHVGDAARADVDGAKAAGVRPLHLDPFDDCPDSAGDHEHLRQLDEVLALLD